MKRFLVALAGAALLGHAPASWAEQAHEATPPAQAAAERPKPEPYVPNPVLAELDVLFRLQDAAARGVSDAASLQKGMLVAVGAKLMALNDAERERLGPYVAGYVLSGGDPQTAETLAKFEGLPAAERHLLGGSALFMKGERQEAAKQLGSLDPLQWPARVAGRLALAQALLTDDEPSRQRSLAIAISAMPGSLIEESALRRSALAYAEARKEEPFWWRLERYQRRFPNSLYAAGFWEEVLRVIVAWHAGTPIRNAEPSPKLERLDLILGSMEVARRRGLYLQLTRLAAAVSDASLTEFAARRLLRLSVAGSQEEQVARLYLALYAVASENSEASRAQLSALNPSLLNAREAALLAAGLSVAREITSEVSNEASPFSEQAKDITPLQSRGEKLLEETEKLLGGGRS